MNSSLSEQVHNCLNARRYAPAVFLIFIFCFTPRLSAAPCYGRRMPDSGKITAGAQTHIIQNRRLKAGHGKVASRQYFYQMSYGLFQWLSLDGKIGIGDVTYKPADGQEAEYPVNFAGGYGFRARFFLSKKQKIDLVCGLQHISVHPGSKKIDDVKNTVILDDWQGSALISKNIGLFTPYAGVRLTRLDLVHNIKGGTRKRKKSDVDIGAVIGGDFNFTESLYVNIEIRFPEESSFNIGFMHNF